MTDRRKIVRLGDRLGLDGQAAMTKQRAFISIDTLWSLPPGLSLIPFYEISAGENITSSLNDFTI